MSYPCPLLNKMGAMICCMTKANKYKKLDRKLERKLVGINRSSSAGQRAFKSIDRVVMRFPQIREGLKTLRGIFEEYDEDSNGSIEYSELKKCFEQLQIDLPEEETKDLFCYCDIDGSKGIQFNEFIVLLCLIYLLEEYSSSDNVLGKKLGFAPSSYSSYYYMMIFVSFVKVELTQLGTIFHTIVEVFLFLDKNGDGKINRKDVDKTLNETYPWERSPADVTKTRFKEMDWDRNGQVTFREFLFGFLKWVGIDEDELNHQTEGHPAEMTD